MTSSGLYIHVPFCVSRCDYCAFATWSDRFDFLDSYVDLVIEEISNRRHLAGDEGFSTIFLGGGTPSLLSFFQLERILEPVLALGVGEVTLEANPDSLAANPKTYLDVGINRISLGVQSLRDSELELLGRKHDAKEAKEAIERLVISGLNFSTDFIFGTRGSRPVEMLHDIGVLIGQGGEPAHLSVYGLVVEPGTPLAERPWLFPDDDQAAGTYLEVSQVCVDLGFECYEISNFARNGQISRHNWNYWMQGSYLGVGPSAHSYMAGKRSWNIRDSYRWGSAMAAGREPTAGSEVLVGSEKVFEGLSLALRTSLGVPVEAMETAAIPEDLYQITFDNRFVLSAKGRLVESAIALLLQPEAVSESELAIHQAKDPFSLASK